MFVCMLYPNSPSPHYRRSPSPLQQPASEGTLFQDAQVTQARLTRLTQGQEKVNRHTSNDFCNNLSFTLLIDCLICDLVYKNVQTLYFKIVTWDKNGQV